MFSQYTQVVNLHVALLVYLQKIHFNPTQQDIRIEHKAWSLGRIVKSINIYENNKLNTLHIYHHI
jgi:hypothetical protein